MVRTRIITIAAAITRPTRSPSPRFGSHDSIKAIRWLAGVPLPAAVRETGANRNAMKTGREA